MFFFIMWINDDFAYKDFIDGNTDTVFSTIHTSILQKVAIFGNLNTQELPWPELIVKIHMKLIKL